MKRALWFFSCKNYDLALKKIGNSLKNKKQRLETISYKERSTDEWKECEKNIISSAKIIFSTLSMTGNKKFEKLEFDYLIVDEACQSNELETLIALQLNPSKIVLVGDNKQLPPTVMSKNHLKTKFSRSLFERLLDCDIDKIMLN